MRVIKTKEGEVIGRYIANHSMTIYEICELAGVDAGHSEDNDYDIDELTTAIDEEEAQELFTDAFYALWAKADFGDPDYDSPYPLGQPWLWATTFKLDAEHPQSQAVDFFEEHRDEIKDLHKIEVELELEKQRDDLGED